MLLALFIRINFTAPFYWTFEFDDCQTVPYERVDIFWDELMCIHLAHAIEIIFTILLFLPIFITISAKQLGTCPTLNRVLNHTVATGADQLPVDWLGFNHFFCVVLVFQKVILKFLVLDSFESLVYDLLSEFPINNKSLFWLA
jgi:hypothetical protein